jgi:short-subunit dehydrogenase
MTPKKIIIVGATSGMGRRMAELYLDKGHHVGITGRRRELLEELKNSYPTQVEFECFDVRGGENIRHIELLTHKLKGLDTLVISAGNGETSVNLDWEIDKWTVETNVNAFVEIANWAFNYFVSQGHGSLATISSIAAIRGSSWAPAYNASKAFQSSYFEGLFIKSKRLKKDISVTCIEPGFVKTKMAKSNKLFWVVPVDKAARQIITAIDKKKRKVYVSRRWWIIAKLLKWIPWWIYRKVG